MGTVDPGPKACAKSSSEQPLDFAIEHPLPLSPFAPRSGLVTPRQTFALRRRAGVSWRRGKAKFQIGRFPRRGGGPRSEFTWKVAPPFRKLKSGSNRLRYDMLIDYVTNLWYRFPSSLMEGRLPETILQAERGSGVLRPRLVTAGSGGPGHRPPGMMTWLRGARCTDPEAMPEMEARPPAENRHGGANSALRWTPVDLPGSQEQVGAAQLLP